MSLNHELPRTVFVEAHDMSRKILKLIQKNEFLNQCERSTINSSRIAIILEDKSLSDLLQSVLRDNGITVYSIWGITDRMSSSGDTLSVDGIYTNWRLSFGDIWIDNHGFKLWLVANYSNDFKDSKLVEVFAHDSSFIDEIIFQVRGF